MNEETLVAFGGELKALGENRYGGYLVVFGDETKTDLTGDFFSAETDFDIDWTEGGKATVYFNHGYDPVLKGRKLGRATLTKDKVGVWMETILSERDEYEKAIGQLAVKGVFGLSSGSASHLVQREPVGGAMHIKHWPIVDASITHTPAEWRTQIRPIKSVEFQSLLDGQTPDAPEATPEAPAGAANAAKTSGSTDIQVITGDETMANEPVSTEDTKGLTGKVDALSERVSRVLKFMEDSPSLKSTGFFTQDGGTADSSIKNAADMLMAIKRGDNARCIKHYGLKAQVEEAGVLGGYYVPQSVLNDLLPSLSLLSGIGQLVRRVPVSTPAGTAPIRDYSRVPTASVGQTASAAGLTSAKRKEGGAYTETSEYFELLKWSVSDYASGYVKMSRELSKDAPMVQAMLEEGIREDVANKEEWAILRGSGAGEPLGVLNWSGVIGITEDTDNTFAVADSDEMVSRLLKRPGARIAWAHHPGVYTNIAGFERGTGVTYQTNLAGALATALHGYPRFDPQHLPAQGASGYVILGDWSSYILFEYEGLYIEFSEHADFLNGNNVWRFGKRQDGMPVMTGPVTLADGSFTLSPFVKLNNKT